MAEAWPGEGRFLPRCGKSKFVSIKERPNRMNLAQRNQPRQTDLVNGKGFRETRWSEARSYLVSAESSAKERSGLFYQERRAAAKSLNLR